MLIDEVWSNSLAKLFIISSRCIKMRNSTNERRGSPKRPSALNYQSERIQSNPTLNSQRQCLYEATHIFSLHLKTSISQIYQSHNHLKLFEILTSQRYSFFPKALRDEKELKDKENHFQVGLQKIVSSLTQNDQRQSQQPSQTLVFQSKRKSPS